MQLMCSASVVPFLRLTSCRVRCSSAALSPPPNAACAVPSL
jgi:hypothetical protein